ncbi:MAG TPA: DNA polymerase III subunit delta [Acholeplasmataceae bacterium]|jgi:DNA polymerase-3 subunit delta|nr:DNA polymerase III subunit delta [Acholeplasmataceae bacterium]
MKTGTVHLFLGDEQYLIENKIKRLINDSGAGEYNVSYYDLEISSLSEALSDALTPPFMSDAKVIVIKNPLFLTAEKNLDKEEKKRFLDYLDAPMETTVLIINGYNIDPDERKQEVKKLLAGSVNYSRELSEIEMYGWIKRQGAINNVVITDEAAREFYRIVGKDLMNAKNELDKLIAYAGDNATVTVEAVRKVAIKEIQNDVYALSNAIVDQDRNKAVRIYRDLIKIGNAANFLFSLVAKSMRELLTVNLMLKSGYNQADVAASMGVSSGRAYYMVKNARSLDYELLRKYVAQLSELDYKIKSGQTDVRTGLEFFLFGI